MTMPQRAFKGLCHQCLKSNVDTVLDRNEAKPICIDCNYHKYIKPKEDQKNA
ncbi:MAG: hypothetical protein HZC29_05170 [Thaumarchaeota archaeon]|nr:hypothetical protein [Nitrososphaerota archaeon]